MNLLNFILGGIMLSVGTFLLYSDYKEDPYGILKLFSYQFLLWWRIHGPLITRKPYIYYFPAVGLLSQDIFRNIAITPNELENGLSKIVKIKTPELCSECLGKRGKALSVQIECSHCQNGLQYHQVSTMAMPLPCKHCLGTGWTPVEKCNTCKGEGVQWKNKKIKIQIPRHSSFGLQLRIPRQGKIEVKTFQIGDLYLKLRKKVFGIF